MPIHGSWKSMIRGLGKQHPGEKECRLVGGDTICVSKKAWSVFYGYIKEHNLNEKTKMPHKIEESLDIMVEWYVRGMEY